MYVAGIQYESLVDGEGLRLTLFCSGCTHYCKGCQNPETHSFTYGKKFDNELQLYIIDYIKNNPMINGLTLSGGDPMFSASELIPFIKKVKKELSYINIWSFSGFTYEQIIKDNDEKLELLKLCDVLVDGKFELEKRDITLSYRGSANQRLINIQQSLKKKEVVLYEML